MELHFLLSKNFDEFINFSSRNRILRYRVTEAISRQGGRSWVPASHYDIHNATMLMNGEHFHADDGGHEPNKFPVACGLRTTPTTDVLIANMLVYRTIFFPDRVDYESSIEGTDR